MSYHRNYIPYNPHSNIYYKLMEEVYELIDVKYEGSKILQLNELSDIYLLMEDLCKELGTDILELKNTADITRRVFTDNHRVSKNIYDCIKYTCNGVNKLSGYNVYFHHDPNDTLNSGILFILITEDGIIPPLSQYNGDYIYDLTRYNIKSEVICTARIHSDVKDKCQDKLLDNLKSGEVIQIVKNKAHRKYVNPEIIDSLEGYL